MPYAAYPNKFGALLFCPMHESIHIGQIGLIRRGLGLPASITGAARERLSPIRKGRESATEMLAKCNALNGNC